MFIWWKDLRLHSSHSSSHRCINWSLLRGKDFFKNRSTMADRAWRVLVEKNSRTEWTAVLDYFMFCFCPGILCVCFLIASTVIFLLFPQRSLVWGHGKGFPGGTSGKEPTCQRRRSKRCEFDPWVRKILWRRAWQPTSLFLPGESHGQRSLAGGLESIGLQRVGHDASEFASTQLSKVWDFDFPLSHQSRGLIFIACRYFHVIHNTEGKKEREEVRKEE